MIRQTSLERRPASLEPDVAGALSDVLLAGQHLVADRIDLARLEIKSTGSRIAAGAAASAGGVALLLFGWVMLMLALFWGLQAVMAPWLSALLVGALNLLMGAFLIVTGARRAAGPSRVERLPGSAAGGAR